jgi:hypothetical protein
MYVRMTILMHVFIRRTLTLFEQHPKPPPQVPTQLLHAHEHLYITMQDRSTGPDNTQETVDQLACFE